MKLVMTLMVRDEADVIEQMLDHHISQGVEQFVITDNGSIDGTTEILERFAFRGIVDLRHDPVHRKQQGSTVTRMARDAYLQHGATWVLNADADEFWLPVDRSSTLRETFETISTSVGAFVVPVIDMTGAPAIVGAGLERLRYRDHRSVQMLNEIGLHAHSTSNTAHVGSADVVVAQGNHFVNIESTGSPPPESAIEVLHFPWRSWRQFRRKVENAGRAYENNPDLLPSPNHHGMREWRRFQEGTLYAWYAARHPSAIELDRGIADGLFVEDTSLAKNGNRALQPAPDDPVDVEEMRAILAVLAGRNADIDRLSAELEQATEKLASQSMAMTEMQQQLRNKLDASLVEATELRRDLAILQSRRVVRLADRVGRVMRRLGAVRPVGRR